MRIAYVCADPGVPVFGRKGCSIHVQEVIRALIRRGASVELFAAATGDLVPPGMESAAVRQLPSPTGTLAERERALRAANPALHDALIDAAGFDLVYERYSLWSFAAMEYARARAVPGVLEVNAPLIDEQTRYRSLHDREGAACVARRVFRAASAVIAVSRQVADHVARYQPESACTYVVPNGVDPQRFTPLRRHREHSAFTVGFVGTLKPWHGVDTLIDAFAILHRRYPLTKLLIVGEGPERPAIEARIASYRLQAATTLTGGVLPQDVPGWLAQMHIAVAPYPALTDFYFSPLKVYEYMAAGLAVVASRIGQLEELIRHDIDGLLCPPADAVAFSRAFERLYRAAPLRQRLGLEARARVLRDHTWDHVIERIMALAGLPAASVLAASQQGTSCSSKRPKYLGRAPARRLSITDSA